MSSDNPLDPDFEISDRLGLGVDSHTGRINCPSSFWESISQTKGIPRGTKKPKKPKQLHQLIPVRVPKKNRKTGDIPFKF